MLNYLIKTSIKHRVVIVLCAVLLSAVGSWQIKQMPVDVFPDLNRPMITVMAEGHGLAAEEVESLITIPIESSLAGLPGVTRVRSSSASGFAIIWVEFEWGTDLYLNRQMVSEKLSTVRSLPDGVLPVMGPVTSLMGEIMLVGLTSDKLDQMQLRTIADWNLSPQLRAIKGVAQVIPIGGDYRQLQVLLDANKMRKFRVPFEDAEKAAASIGANTSGGFLESTHQEYLVRNIFRPRTPQEAGETVVRTVNGVPVSLNQIADVKFGAKFARGAASINAQPGVILGIRKQPGVNTLSLTSEIESVIAKNSRSLNDVDTKVLFRQASFIERSVHNVIEALRDGSIFVAIILFLFLFEIRTTVITLTAIPLSLFISFIVLKYLGFSINTMILGGLAVAIGELVDDAIVDVENVFRRLRENRLAEHPQNPLIVIFKACQEVRNSIVVATAIVVMVFFPLFFMGGLEGRLFVPLGVAYVVSILASLFVSLTVTPALCAMLLTKIESNGKNDEDNAIVKRLKSMHLWLLNRSLPHPRVVLAIAGSLVILAGVGTYFAGKDFLPPFNEGTVTVFVATPPGTSLAESNRIGALVEQELLKVKSIETTGRRTGRAEEDEHAEGVYNSEIDIDLAHIDRSKDEVLAEIRAVLAKIPGISANIGQPIAHRIDHMMTGVRSQFAIKIYGDDLRILRSVADRIKANISDIRGLVDLQVEKVTNIPQVHVQARALDLKRAGLSPGDLAERLETIIAGEDVGFIMDGQARVPVMVRLKEDYRSSPEQLERILIDTPVGGSQPLGSLADIVETTGPNTINRENSRRRIIVMGNAQNRDVAGIAEDIIARINNMELPDGYNVKIDGQYESQKQASTKIASLAVLSFGLIFGLLFFYFRSWFIAAQVLLNIPLALIGSVVAVYLSGGTMSIGTYVGFITLCGIASRNGILLISHYLHLMKEEGESFTKEMVVRGSLERLVPVLMTAVTAMLALIPLALAGGEAGKEILHPVAVVILGGLISSTLLDMVVTPTVFFNFGKKSAEGSLRRSEGEEAVL